VVGAYAEAVAAGARSAGLDAARVAVAEDKPAMLAAVAAGARSPDIVLVKASRGLALETVAADLLTDVPGAAERDGGSRAS
jgi:UDP-N-acetylmuramoyl-tripeptide--D-alanyl-D-alanine ligase